MCMYRFAENVHFVGGDKYLIFNLCLFSDMSFDINMRHRQGAPAMCSASKQKAEKYSKCASWLRRPPLSTR